MSSIAITLWQRLNSWNGLKLQVTQWKTGQKHFLVPRCHFFHTVQKDVEKWTNPETFDTLIMDREPSNYSFPIQRPVSQHGCCKFPIFSADSSFFLARIMDFTCKKDRIADLPNRQRGFLFYSLESDLRIYFNRSTDFVIKSYQIAKLHTLVHPTPYKAIHRLQQRALNSFHCEDHKDDEEETLVQYGTYHARFLKRLLSKWK